MKQMFFSVDKYSSDTVVKNEARQIVFDLLTKFFEEEYGEHNVTQVGANELAVCIGERNGKEVVVTIKPTAKDCGYRSTATKSIVPYNRFKAGEEYDEKASEKLQKKAEAQAKKKTTPKAIKEAEKKEKLEKLEKVAETVKAKQSAELSSAQFVVRIDGVDAIEPTTLDLAKAKSTELKDDPSNEGKEIKLFKVL